MNTTNNSLIHNEQDILKTAQHIINKQYSNASFSNMDVVFLSKETFVVVQDIVSKVKEKGWKDSELHKQWKTIQENDSSYATILKSIEKTMQGVTECVFFENTNLVVLNKNYYSFLCAACDFAGEE